MGGEVDGLTLAGPARRLEALERENERMRSGNSEPRYKVATLKGSDTGRAVEATKGLVGKERNAGIGKAFRQNTSDRVRARIGRPRSDIPAGTTRERVGAVGSTDRRSRMIRSMKKIVLLETLSVMARGKLA